MVKQEKVSQLLCGFVPPGWVFGKQVSLLDTVCISLRKCTGKDKGNYRRCHQEVIVSKIPNAQTCLKDRETLKKKNQLWRILFSHVDKWKDLETKEGKWFNREGTLQNTGVLLIILMLLDFKLLLIHIEFYNSHSLIYNYYSSLRISFYINFEYFLRKES